MSSDKKKTDEELLRELERLQVELQLDVVDKQILKLKSIDPRLDCRTIGKRVGMHHASIAARLKKPALMLALDKLNHTTADIMRENARKAAMRLSKLLESPNERTVLEAAKLCLAPILNQHTHTVNTTEATIYKTTVQPDSSLLQQVIEAEIVTTASQVD